MLILKKCADYWLVFWLGDSFTAEVSAEVAAELLEGRVPGDLRRLLEEQQLLGEGDDPAVCVRDRTPLVDCEAQITEQCNLRCKHCFIKHPSNGVIPVERFAEICRCLHELHAVNLIVTGGEPLVLKQFWSYLDLARASELNIQLITNGTLLGPGDAARLSEYPIWEICLSIDGYAKEHDEVRGRGTFRKTMEALRLLAEAGLNPVVNTVVGHHNVGSLAGFTEYVVERGAYGVHYSRLRCFLGCQQQDLELSPGEFAGFLRDRDIFRKERPHWNTDRKGLECCGSLASIAIQTDGTVLPCYLLPDFPMGNIHEQPLTEIYQQPRREALWAREIVLQRDLVQCMACEYLPVCRTGCRAEALAVGDRYGCDPYARAMCGMEQRRREAPAVVGE